MSGNAFNRLAAVAATLTVALGGCASKTEPTAAGGTSSGSSSSTSSSPSSGTPSTGSARSSTWTDYLGPLRTGYTCTLTSTASQSVGGKQVDATVTIVRKRKVTPLPDGGSRVFDAQTSAVHSASNPSADHGPMPIASSGWDVHPDGSVTASPLPDVPGLIRYQVTSADPLPAISALKAGESATLDTAITVTGSSAAGRAALAPYTVSGASGVPISVSLNVSGQRRPTITTPAGAFADVVGEHVVVTGVKYLKVPPGREAQVRQAEQAGNAAAGASATTVWFARGVGPVLIESAKAQGPNAPQLSGCTG